MAIVATHVQAVQNLYVAYFGRPADTAGLDYWTNVVEANKGVTTAVSAAFAKETEYTDLFKGLNNGQVVDKIYTNMFGHAADAAGRAYWVKLLDDKVITIDTVVADVAKGAQTTDKETVENKGTAAVAFTAALDTAAEQAGYGGAGALPLAKSFLAGITTDASLAAAIAPAALNATVSAVVIAGTPFSVNGALARLETAQKAEAAFLVTADGDNNANTSATEVSLDAAVNAKGTAVGAALPAAQQATYTSGSAAVKAAVVADAQAANNTKLAADQAAVTAANNEIAKVAGLQAAVTTLAGAKASLAAATTVQNSATADLNGKVSFYNLTNGATITVAADGSVTGLITANATTGKLSLATGITESTNPGITAVLNASTAVEGAEKATANASTVVTAAQQSVDFLDSNAAQVTALNTLKAEMTSFTFGADVLPTEAQINEQIAIFQAADTGASTVYEEFLTDVATFRGVAAANNPLNTTLTGAEATVKATTASIKALNDAVTGLATAEANVIQYDALHASVTTATKVFTDNGYALQNVDTAFEIGSASSDIFVVGKTSSTISLFGLQGADSLYIGSGYTLNTGALSTGNNAVLEAFVSQSGLDTVIRVETSAFGSSAATPEVVTITLVGVDATDIQLNNGIISVVTGA
jgi:hypothetical protein